MVGKPLPKTQSSMRAKSNAKASKKRSMFNLFMVARPFSLPPPADVTSGNKETDEDNDEALRVIIRWTKQKKRKHRLAAVVGRLESEWSFIRQIEISLPFFYRLGIDSTIIVTDCGGLAGNKYTSLRFLFHILIKKCTAVSGYYNCSPPLSLAPVSPPPPPPPLPPLRCHPFASSPSPPPRLSASAASPSTPPLHRLPSVASPPLPPLRRLPASLPPLPPLRRLPFNSSPPPPPLHLLRFAASPPPPALHRLPFPKAVKTDAAAAATSTPKFYSADDVKPRQPSTRKPNATNLRSSIMPGTVLILLAGRFMGKRVVFLKQLKSGLLLLTGPFKINGVPIRRVNHAYVITTSTKVDVFGINVPEALFLLYHKHDVPVKWVCRELEGQRPFGAEDMQPLEAPRFMWWADELAAAVAVGSSRPMPSRTVKAKAPKNRSMSYLFMVAPSLTLPPPTDQSG
ncbi:hypothetical protein GUJ93_ZPchr0681g6577 [Zizania palustris]|uniref:60S ribosomal protein L6 n=1 Tax=Zizania palustris TaxID=103762 RepID=A0A8J5V233_ZIZPA|nr:hypothetical protein GUJ93_ZPchr0681g6577 [Zizania palustris]